MHSSNVKIKCCSCLDWAHFKCRGTEDTSFICKNCISSNLPFSEVENENDFNYEVGLDHCSLSSQLSDLNNMRFSLNPFNDSENNKFINNSDIDADDNYFNFFTGQCLGYIDSDQINTHFQGEDCKNNLKSIMHINAHSMIANIDVFCSNLKLLKHKFSFICVSETWTTVSTEQFIEIPGYDCICRSRSSKRGGGLALYVDSDMNVSVKIRSDLDNFDSSVYESLIVQISQPTISVKDIIIGVIYKPPNTNVETFLSHFIVVLEKLSKENRPSYLLGDYNIDLLKYNHHSESFLNQLLTYGFFPKIDRPTRITNTSATLIDNIITDVHDKNLISGIWTASVSDHLPIFLSLPHQILKRTPCDRTEIKRIYSNQNYENFQNMIRDIDWSTVYNIQDINDKYTCFSNIISDAHEKCFPLKSVKVNPMRDTKPWITTGILKFVKKRMIYTGST